MILYHTDLKIRGVEEAQPIEILPNALLNERNPTPNRRRITKNLHPYLGCSTAIRTILRLPKASSLSSQHLTMPPWAYYITGG